MWVIRWMRLAVVLEVLSRKVLFKYQSIYLFISNWFVFMISEVGHTPLCIILLTIKVYIFLCSLYQLSCITDVLKVLCCLLQCKRSCKSLTWHVKRNLRSPWQRHVSVSPAIAYISSIFYSLSEKHSFRFVFLWFEEQNVLKIHLTVIMQHKCCL